MPRKTVIKLNTSNYEVQASIVEYIVKSFDLDYDGCNGYKEFGFDFQKHSEFCYASDGTYYYEYGDDDAPCWLNCPHAVSTKTAFKHLMNLLEPSQLAQLNEVIETANKNDDPINEFHKIIFNLDKTTQRQIEPPIEPPKIKQSMYLTSFHGSGELSKLKLTSTGRKLSEIKKYQLLDYYQITAIVSDDDTIDRKVDLTLRSRTWEDHFIDLNSKMNTSGFSFGEWCNEHHKNIYYRCPAILYPDLDSAHEKGKLTGDDNDKIGGLWYDWYEEFQDWDDLVQSMFVNPKGEKIQNIGMRKGHLTSFTYCKYIRSISIQKIDSEGIVWNVDL